MIPKQLARSLGFALLALIAFVAPLQAAELTVSAAISLREAFSEIGAEFEKTRPGTKVLFNFAASGALAQQIARGAPVDVFASAAAQPLASLEKQGLTTPARPFARNRLVVIVPVGQTRLTSFEQLARVSRLTIGNPKTVPAGQYASEALTKAGIYQNLLAAQKLVFAENVRQALAYVENSNVAAGIVYATDARISSKVSVSFALPAEYSAPVIYPIAAVGASKQALLAQAFIDFVLSPGGQTILQAKGFLAPGP